MAAESSTALSLLGSLASTATAGTSGPNPTIEPYTTDLNGVDQPANRRYRDALFWFLGILGVCVLLIRILEISRAWIRHKVAMGKPEARQIFWRDNQSAWWPWIKRNVTYAPLGKKRHNREMRLSSAVSVGTLPSRFHMVLLTVYFLSNFAYCAALDYSIENKWAVAAQLRGRSGVLALSNMVPLVIFAGRNNPLIPLLKISFDTYNLLHRWMGRMVVLESVIHTLAWLITQIASDGWSSVARKISTDPFILWGTIGTASFIIILFSSPSPLRHAFYETFLNVHIILAFASILAVCVHVKLGHLYELLPYAIGVFVIWIVDRLFRVVRIIYYNYSPRGGTYATVEALPGEACRVTLHLPTYLNVAPGSHAYLRFLAIKPWESHPFSIAWTSHTCIDTVDVLPTTEKAPDSPIPKSSRTSVSFLISAHTGMTRSLYTRALAAPSRRLRTRAAFEGPYAGHHSLASYGHCVLVAGSSGITHQISHVHQLLSEFPHGTIATRRITLIWIVRDLEHLEWVRPWMDELLRMPMRRELLVIKLFVTRPRSAAEVTSPSQTVQMFPGRPNIRVLLLNEVVEQVGAMCVTVCGPGGLADNVREVVREVQGCGVIDFVEEAFTW